MNNHTQGKRFVISYAQSTEIVKLEHMFDVI